MTTEVQIYGPVFSSFVRVVMLCCEEKGIGYRAGLTLDGAPIEFKSEDHHALHPWGKIPVIKHRQQTLYETATICRYLDSYFDGPALQPEDPAQRAQVDQWCATLSLYVDKALVRDYLLEFAFPKGENGQIRMDKVLEAEPAVKAQLAIINTQLADQAFLCGASLTLADLMLLPMLDYVAGLPQGDSLIEPGSALANYLERMRARPSAQKVLQQR